MMPLPFPISDRDDQRDGEPDLDPVGVYPTLEPEGDKVLDPDIDDDLVDSAEADRIAAEGDTDADGELDSPTAER
jgi:hypothetical protein